MAARINTKFLLIVIIVLGMVGALVGGMLIFNKKTAKDFHDEAKQAQANGNFIFAERQYYRSLALNPNYKESIDGLIALHDEFKPQSESVAREFLDSYVRVRSHRTYHLDQERTGDTWAELLGLCEMGARVLRPDWWDESLAGDATERWLVEVPEPAEGEDGAERARAEAWRAMWLASPIAAGRNLNAIRTDEQIQAGLDLARVAVDRDPTSDLAWSVLLAANVHETNRINREGTRQEAAAANESLSQLMAEIEAREDRGVRTSTELLNLRLVRVADTTRELFVTRELARGARSDSEADEIAKSVNALTASRQAEMDAVKVIGGQLEEVLAELAAKPDGDDAWDSTVQRGIRALALATRVDDTLDPLSIARKALDAKSPMSTYIADAAMGAALEWTRNVSGADDEERQRTRLERIAITEEIAGRAADLPDPPVGLDSLIAGPIRRSAQSILVECAYLRWSGEPESPERDALGEAVAAAAAVYDASVTAIGNDPGADDRSIFHRGLAAYASGAPSRATPLLFNVTDRDEPRLDRFRLTIARQVLISLLQEEGAHAEAVEVAMKVVEAGNPRPSVLAAIGRSRVALGEFDGALAMAAMLESQGLKGTADELRNRVANATGGPFQSPALQRITELASEIQDGSIDAADALAEGEALVAADPDNPSLQYQLVRVAVAADRRDRAIELLEGLRSLAPNDRRVQAELARLQSDDPVDQIVSALAMNYDELSERTVMTLVNLERAADRLRAALEEAGDVEQTALERDLAAFDGAISEYEREARTRIEAGDATLTAREQWYSRELRRAVDDKRWDDADGIVSIFRTDDLDRAGGSWAAGLVSLNRSFDASGQERTALLQDAVSELERAVEIVPFSARIWRNLSTARSEMGDLEDAVGAMSRAYENDPVDLEIALAYITILLEADSDPRAREVAFATAQRHPEDRQVRERWLGLERRAGNYELVLAARREIYAENPDDLQNARQYTLALADTRPSRELMIDESGTPRYSIARWEGMTTARQEGIIAEERTRWLEDAVRIADSTRPDPDRGLAALDWRLVRSQVDRAAGDTARSLARVQEAVELQDDAQGLRAAYASVVRWAFSLNQSQAAADVLRQLQQSGDPDLQRDASWMLSRVLFEQQAFARAVAPLEAILESANGESVEVFEADPDSGRVRGFKVAPSRIETELITALVAAGQTDRAREVLAGSTVADTRQGRLFELQFTIIQREGARSRGDAEELARRTQEADAIIDELIADDPRDWRPWGIRIASLLRESEVSGRPALVSEAESVLRSATLQVEDTGALFESELRVLEANGDFSRIGTLLAARLAERPSDDALRGRVFDAAMADREFRRAQQVAEEGIEIDGFKAEAVDWQRRLARAYRADDRPGDAARTLAGALQTDSNNEAVLREAVSAWLAMDPPELQAVVGTLRGRDEFLATNPLMHAAYGRALFGRGDRAGAGAAFEAAFRELDDRVNRRVVDGRAFNIYIGFIRDATGEDRMSEVEQVVRGFAGDSPSLWIVAGLANAWFTSGHSDAYDRGIELQREAVAAATGETPLDLRIRAMLRSNLGGMLQESGQGAAAFEQFELALGDSPDDPMLLNNVAYMQSTIMGDPAGGYPRILRALALQPRNWQFLDSAGKICALLERFEESETYLRRSIRIREASRNLFTLAELLVATDRGQEALTVLDRASEILTPGDGDLRTQIDDLADRISAGGS